MMAASIRFKGTGLWKSIASLTKDNSDDWFTDLDEIVIGEEVGFLLQKDPETYYLMTESFRKTSKVNINKDERSSTGTEGIWIRSEREEHLRSGDEPRWHNATLEAKYVRARSNFLINFNHRLSEIDRERIKEIKSINDKIAKLKAVYTATTFRGSRLKINAFTMWKGNSTIRPTDNYVKLITARREAHKYSGAMKFDDKYTWDTFVCGLRPADTYSSM